MSSKLSGESFGQKRPPLYEMIRNILRDYPSGQIFKVRSSHNIIDLFTIRDCWNVNEMQIAFTIGCGQVTPTSILGGTLQYDSSDKLVIKYIYS